MVATYKLNVSMAQFQTSKLSKTRMLLEPLPYLLLSISCCRCCLTALLGPISAIIAVLSLLYEGLKFVIGLFQSDAYKRYKETMEAAREATKELGNSLEVDRALQGTSKKIGTVSQRTIAYGNALGELLKEIDKVEESGFEGYLGGAIDLLKDAAENSNLFREQLRQAGIQKINQDTVHRVMEIAEAEKAAKQSLLLKNLQKQHLLLLKIL